MHTTYVAARVGTQNLYLHRWLMGAGAGQVVHHRDRNGLNNCRSNLVLTDQSTNIGNKRVLKQTKTGYRGVHLRAKDGRYVAEIKVRYRKRHLGSFSTAWDAAQAYNAAATEAWGEHAVLNEPQSAKDGGSGCPGTVM